MTTNNTHKQRELWWANLPKYDETVGRESYAKHVCLILQEDGLNKKLPSTIIVPLFKGHRKAPEIVNVEVTAENGLDEPRHIDLTLLRSISVTRLISRMGILEEAPFWQIEGAFYSVFGDLFNLEDDCAELET